MLSTAAQDVALLDEAFGGIGYGAWRTQKLALPPPTVDALTVAVRDPLSLSDAERTALRERCLRYNMAIYTLAVGTGYGAAAIAALAGQLGLRHIEPSAGANVDGIAEIRAGGGNAGGYIPYSEQPLGWHTDGYYNDARRPIRAFVLHCLRPAKRGGANVLLDPEIVYAWLRERNPGWIAALSHARAMTIPAREQGGTILRAARTGPVFSLDATTGRLHLRYTARTRSIAWRDDATTLDAADALRRLLGDESPYHVRIRLQTGQGLICNNVLHCREAFNDDGEPGRTLLRARYLDRIAET